MLRIQKSKVHNVSIILKAKEKICGMFCFLSNNSTWYVKLLNIDGQIKKIGNPHSTLAFFFNRSVL